MAFGRYWFRAKYQNVIYGLKLVYEKSSRFDAAVHRNLEQKLYGIEILKGNLICKPKEAEGLGFWRFSDFNSGFTC